jgi:hypothetical protein
VIAALDGMLDICMAIVEVVESENVLDITEEVTELVPLVIGTSPHRDLLDHL